MLEVLPLSPVREWAISRSFIASRPHKADLRPGEFAWQQDRSDRDDIAGRFEGTAAGGRAVGIKRFDFVAYANGLAQVFGATGNANTHFIGLVGVGGDFSAMQCVDADEREPPFAGGHAAQLQPLPDDLQREPSACQGTGTGVGNLALTDIAVDIADRDLQRVGAPGPAPATDALAVSGYLLDPDLRKIRDHVGLDILAGIVHFIEQLFLAGLRRHRAAGARDLGDHEAAILADFTDGKTEPRQIGNILVAGVGEVA